MKLESLKLDKFKINALKKEQMFNLNGGGTETAGGAGQGTDNLGRCVFFDYGYDSNRGGIITYHNRSNVSLCTPCP